MGYLHIFKVNLHKILIDYKGKGITFQRRSLGDTVLNKEWTSSIMGYIEMMYHPMQCQEKAA